MYNSAAWIISAVLSLAAHYGLMSAAGHISIAEPQQDQLAIVVLGNAALQPVAVIADLAGSEALAEASQAVDAAAANATPLKSADAQPMTQDTAKTAIDPTRSGQETAETPAADLAPTAGAVEAPLDKPEGTREAEQGGSDIAQDRASAAPAMIASSETASAAPAPDLAAGNAPTLAAEARLPAPPADAPAQLPPTAPSPAEDASGAASVSLPQETSSPAAATESAPLRQDTNPAARPGESLSLQPENNPAAVTAAAVPLPPEKTPPAEATANAPLTPGSAAPSVANDAASLQPEASAAVVVPEVPAAAAADHLPPAGEIKVAAAATASAKSQGDRIRSFMRDYQGQGCIYATADDIDGAKPRFSGLGGRSGAVDDFVTAFKDTVGVDPAVELRAVMDAQCPAVDFIKAISGNPGQDFTVKLDAETVRDGNFLVGRLEGSIEGSVHLLTVDDAGTVVDISQDFHRAGKDNFFAVEVSLLADGRGRNQLVIAIVARQSLEISRAPDAPAAIELFRSIVQQIARQGGAVNSAYAAFTVE